MPRPRSLTRPQIAAAALAVLDRDGLAALTMRAVARETGVSTMALYRYVEDRDELEEMMVDAVFAAVDTTPPPPGRWRDRVADLAERVRAAVAAHPAILPLTVAHRHRSPGLLRWSETVLEVLTGAGVTGAARVVALRSLTAYVIGAVQLEHLGPLAGPGTGAIAALPADAFPLMAATARDAARIDAAAEFRRGLDLLLGGMDAPGTALAAEEHRP
ncbi:TetR/AcrR family transcriptional regulator [Actinomadura rayongensis]|uniref:TetR family transcriptional regulator n=1 Tax=Actinomadura rayongensis TaxID=1429076 RepID=A0A6I4WH04_9ACTN|nr:TetR/AcrR family transcriptional regulator [Actinomadura rayongensis]MXQ68193.1 TetR family transcriptional regulator [Actinomadura rayongensis]